MRSLILAALAAVLLVGCATSKGVPRGEVDQALAQHERCAEIERTSCYSNRTGTVIETESSERAEAAKVNIPVPYGSYGYGGGYGGYGTGVFGGGQPFPTYSCQAPLPNLPPSCGLRY